MNQPAVSSRTSRVDAEGFTLVELSIVVAIVGILAVLATVGYRRLIATSHLTEATGLVNGIRVAQESFHAETGYYANVSNTVTVNWVGLSGGCPAGAGLTVNGNKKFGWDPACGAGVPFSTLPLHVDTAVMYGYATISNNGNATTFAAALPKINGTAITATAPPGDWYVVSAVGDTDADGDSSAVCGQSATNQLFIQGDGN